MEKPNSESDEVVRPLCPHCEGWGVVEDGPYHYQPCALCETVGFVIDTTPPAPVRAIPDPFACLRDESEAAE